MVLVEVLEHWHTEPFKYVVDVNKTSQDLKEVGHNILPADGLCPRNKVCTSIQSQADFSKYNENTNKILRHFLFHMLG